MSTHYTKPTASFEWKMWISGRLLIFRSSNQSKPAMSKNKKPDISSNMNELITKAVQQTTAVESERLLLVLPIQAYSAKGRIFIDKQACNGLRLWLENFKNVTLACIVNEAEPPSNRSPIDQIAGFERLRVICLPLAYAPHKFLASLPKILPILSQEVASSQFLHFAIGGLWGDWGAVASLVASRAKRRFAIWTDRVESRVISFQARAKPLFRRIYWKSTAYLMKHFERYVISKSAIGLFHGMDCYAAYAQYCKDPHLVHDIHLDYKDHVTEAELEVRLARDGPIRIVYAGRVHRDKGVFDWIRSLSLAASTPVDFVAVWFGDGPELATARHQVASLGLADRVSFPGAIEKHADLIRKLKTFDAFVFCHKTPESPRCLIEALICGLPLIGYEGQYQNDLIQKHSGGLLTPIDHPERVAESISSFWKTRTALTQAAKMDGSTFDASEVFRHRSELMRQI
jgi:colanic acid/amylovoran biosynthesis glycosyltransferase